MDLITNHCLGTCPLRTAPCTRRNIRTECRNTRKNLLSNGGPAKLAWRQLAHMQNKIVLEIRAQRKDEPFPPYLNFMHKVRGLNGIHPSWQVRLKERMGVYLLTFDDGMQYVGSATGEQGFWQRWSNYLTNGHGGNRILIRDQRDARVALVSILEVSGSAQTERDIINQEMRWKQKLG